MFFLLYVTKDMNHTNALTQKTSETKTQDVHTGV